VKGVWSKRAIWLISLSRNVIVIVASSLVACVWDTPPFHLVGTVVGGLNPVGLPPFRLPRQGAVNVNRTNSSQEDIWMTFAESWAFIGSGPLIIALISVLQNVAIGKAFGAGGRVDGGQEMLALGVGSVAGGFLSAIPVSASFSRSAVNEASGVRTPLGGLWTGGLVLLSLAFLTPSFYFIPKAALSAVIIAAVMFMVDVGSVGPMWRVRRMEAIACLVTFVASLLLGMEYGILIGVGLSVGGLLMKTLEPEVTVEVRETSTYSMPYVLIRPQANPSGLAFPSVDYVAKRVQKAALNEGVGVVVLDVGAWQGGGDYTAALTLLSLEKGLRKGGKALVLLDASEVWMSALKHAGGGWLPPATSLEGLEACLRDLVEGEGKGVCGRSSFSSVAEEGGGGGSSIVSSSDGGNSTDRTLV
jgi:sodium-independent sulfate anion transporter 11